MAYGPRVRSAVTPANVLPNSDIPDSFSAPPPPQTVPCTPQAPLFMNNGFNSNVATTVPNPNLQSGLDWPSAVPRSPARVSSRGHQPPAMRRHSRTPPSASHDRNAQLSQPLNLPQHGEHAQHASSVQYAPTQHHAPIPAQPSVNGSDTSSNARKRTSVGDWDFVKSIGAGSMGQVKLAVNRYTKQFAAIKIVPKAFTHRPREGRESNEAKDARVIREAAIGRLLEHPNISRLYDVFSMTGHFYLVFEYISGGQMLDYIISHGCVKETQARRFARSISSALDYCHHNSVVHRDLKIENILIADDGDIRLIDFGLSNLFRRDNLLRTFCGSLYFAAPELLNAMPYIGPEIDVWSFGIVIYVLVSGKVPFEDKSMTVLHAKIKRGIIEYPQWLSSLCVDLLRRMLNVNPSERATLSDVMHHPWMCKGFDGPPESYIPRRLPLTYDSIDCRVIEEMEHLGIGDGPSIEHSLRQVLGSAEYQLALDNWYDYQESSLNLEYRPPPALGSRVPDPLDSFSPEISCYFLTRERMAKSSSLKDENDAPEPPAPQPLSRPHSRTPSQKAAVHQSALQQPLPLTPGISSPEPGVKAGRSRAQTLGTSYDMPQPAIALSSSPDAEEPAKAFESGIPQQAQLGIMVPMNAVKPVILGRGQSMSSSSTSPRARGKSRVVSQPVPQSIPQLLPMVHQIANSQVASQLIGQSGQPMSLLRRLTLRRKSAGHSRAKSTSHATSEHAIGIREPSLASQQNLAGMPSIASPKPVFFRGIFSVQSTSTRPLQEIRSEIIRVLTQKQIEFVEVKGGFACVARQHLNRQLSQSSHVQRTSMPQTPSSSSTHGNSIGSIGSAGSGNAHSNHANTTANATNASTTNTSLGMRSTGSTGSGHASSQTTPLRTGYGDYLVLPSPHSPPSTPRHRLMISENGIDSPAGSFGASTDSIDMEIGGSDMLGESRQRSQIPIRFEIDIVRVPIVSLHGIQFKKLTGNVWLYKNLAQGILESLRL